MSGKINIRVAEPEDIQVLKARLREKDAQEILASGYASVEGGLAESYERSTRRYTVELDGVPVALFGIVASSLLGNTANVWFLGAPELARIKKSFVKISRNVVAYFLAQYPRLWNVVDERYTETFPWLRLLGAHFGRAIKIKEFTFIPFIIERGS